MFFLKRGKVCVFPSLYLPKIGHNWRIFAKSLIFSEVAQFSPFVTLHVTTILPVGPIAISLSFLSYNCLIVGDFFFV